MNMHQPIPTTGIEAEARAHAKAVRERLFNSGRKTSAANQNTPAVKREPEPRDVEFFPVLRRGEPRKQPQWALQETHFNAHITAWQLWRAETLAINGAPLKAYIRRRAMEMGLTYAQVVGPSRKREVAEARQVIMWEIKTTLRPGVQGERDYISYPELGRLFGGRDHTTCLWAVRKIEAQNRDK